MTTKRLPKKQPERDRLITNTLLGKPLAECTAEECIRLDAFFDAVLKYLRGAGATVTKLPAREPSRRVWSGEDSQAA